MPRARSQPAELQARFRIIRGSEIAFGPGKADLLERIAETGSIAQAAKRLEMSYMRAWSLVETMNASFREPLVEKVRGGQQRGGARLTAAGKRVLELYRQLGARSRDAVRTEWEAIQGLLRVE